MAASLESQKLQAEIDLLKAKRVAYEYEATETELRVGPKLLTPFRHRVYNFWNHVSKSSVYGCVDALGTWLNESRDDPIHININTPGGSIFDGLALYDYVLAARADGVEVNTSCVGMAASMGGVLLQMGEERTMSPNAYLMIHEASSEAWGKASEMVDHVDLIQRLQGRTIDILAERSTLTARQIKAKIARKDWYLDADEALALGFVDAIR